jgi:hypothetical protein
MMGKAAKVACSPANFQTKNSVIAKLRERSVQIKFVGVGSII